MKAIAEAEAAVAAVEAIEGPNHYDEVAGIEDLFKAADEAVALVEDALTRFGFEKRVDVERKAFLTILQKHVDAVNSANTDLDLLEALVAFWTVESDLIGVYKDLVDDKDNDTSDVHKIQKNVIEKAPLTLEETTIVEAIVKSAKSESLIKFKETLSGYAFYFERINFDSNAVLEEYRMDIADSKDLSSLEEIQEIIDEVNYDYAKDAVDEATKSIDRKDWNEAVALLVYVADGEDKEALQKDLDAHDLILKVSEAQTAVALQKALADLKVKYVYVALLDDYLEAIEEAEPITFDAVQVVINGVNQENVEGILKEIAELDKDSKLSYVEVLLNDLDAATPIFLEKEVDFDLSDKELKYDRARMEFYRAALAELEDDIAIADVIQAIKDGNNEADAQFKEFKLEKTTALVDEPVVFTVNALNVIGEAFTDFHGTAVSVDVTIGKETEEVGATFAADVLTVSTEEIKFKEIGEHAATLTFTIGEDKYTLNTTVLINAKASKDFSTVKTNAKEYKSGDEIQITVTLLYNEDKVLTTENKTYPGVVTIGTDIYNREFAFTNGVAVVSVPARTAVADVTVSIDVNDLHLDSKQEITIKAGDPQQLTIERNEDDMEVVLVVRDARGNEVEGYKGQSKVELSLTKITKAAISPASVNVPDEDGIAWVTFDKGRGVLDFTDSPFLNNLIDLEEGDYKLTIKVVELNLSAEIEFSTEEGLGW